MVLARTVRNRTDGTTSNAKRPEQGASLCDADERLEVAVTGKFEQPKRPTSVTMATSCVTPAKIDGRIQMMDLTE